MSDLIVVLQYPIGFKNETCVMVSPPSEAAKIINGIEHSVNPSPRKS